MRLPSLWRLPDYSLPVLVILTLAAALLWTPADSALAQDAAGPKIADGPTIASSPESGDIYRAGETITVEVTFSEPVTVTGKPRLRLNIGDKKRWAKYDSTGADGATLSFTHTVKLSAQDADGVSIGRNQLRLNGGKIKDAEDNAAKLKHPALPDQAGHKVNGATEEAEPTATATPQPPEPTQQEQAGQQQQQASNSPPQFADNTAARSVNENTAAGENVGDPVTATDDDGDNLTYALTGADAGAFDLDADTGQIQVKDALDYESKASYSLTVTVQDGKDAGGDTDTGVDDSIAVTVSVVNVDEPGSVSFDSQTPTVGSEFTAIVSDPDGGVREVLYVWQSSTDRDSWGNIPGGSLGTYTPSAADVGKYLRATASYADAQGGYEIKYTGWAVTANPIQPPSANGDDDGEGAGKSSQAATTGAVIITAANPPPSITQGPILNIPKSGDTYGVGEKIIVNMTFSKSVAVSGAPRIGIDVGENRRYAEYGESLADGATLVFSYTVQADDTDDDGISIAGNALELNGGSIEDGDGNAADLAHPAWAASSNHKVDGSASLNPGEPQNTAPAGFMVNANDFDVTLHWTNPSDTTITKYQYRYKKVADSVTTGATTADTVATGYTPWIDMAGSGSTTIRHEVCLAGGSKYKFEVRAETTGPQLAAAYVTTKLGGAALTSAPQELTVTTDDTHIIPRIPRGRGPSLSVGDKFRILFITNTTRDNPAAASSDIADYNSCAALAAKRSSTWHAEDRYLQFRALVSTQMTDARGNTATTYTDADKGVPIYWKYFGWGLKVADDYEDFYDGDWDSVSSTSLAQILYSPPKVWTGSIANGTKAGANGANAAGASQVAYGTLENSTTTASNFGTETLYKGLAASATELPIYVLSPVITIGAPPSTEKPAKPFNLKGRPGDGEVTLSWDDPQNSSIDKYQYAVVKRTWNADNMGWSGIEQSSLTYTDITGSDADTTSYTVTGLENHAHYYLYIRAVNGAGESLFSGLGRVPHAQSSGFTSSPQDGATYKNGEVITVRINFLFPLFFTDGPPTLPIMIGTEERLAECEGLSSTQMQGSVALVCKYTVQTGDVDTDGIGVEADKLKLNGSFKTVPRPSVPSYTAIGHAAYSPASVQKVDGSQIPPPEPQTVPANWALIPSGVSVGDSFRLLFVANVGTQATSTDIAYYNTHVQNAANNNQRLSPFSDQFRALISTATVHARDNTDTAPANGSSYAEGEGVPIYWLEGKDYSAFNYDCRLRTFPRNKRVKVKAKVADDYADFYDGTWDSRCGRIHNGSILGKWRVWTGSNADGTRHSPQNAGQDSQYAGQDNVKLGQVFSPFDEVFDPLPGPISSRYDDAKTEFYRLYALSPVLTVVPLRIPARPTGFTATPAHEKVTLRWTNPGDINITKWQYRYKKGSGNAGEYGDPDGVGWTDILGISALTNAFYAVGGLTNGTTYTFQVRAFIEDNAGPPSAEQSARPASTPSSAQITAIRLKDNDNRFGVPINLINRGFQLIIEVEYDSELPYDSLPQAFPLMLGSFGGSANSEEELKKMGYKGEPSNTDPNIRYAELVRDSKWKSKRGTGGGNRRSYLKPFTEGKVVTYKYTVRWGDLDDDGVSIVRPDTGAVMTFPQKVNGRY